MRSLPSFSSPPVVETAIAVQFRPLKGLKNVHLAEFWSSIAADYPATLDQEPLPPRLESFDAPRPRGPVLQIQAAHLGGRIQAVSADQHAMVQLQNGWFIYNWRRLAAKADAYPRWSTSSAEFTRRSREFSAFLEGRGFGRPDLVQWEVTYVNHLMKGDDWASPKDWPGLLPGLLGAWTPTTGSVEALSSDVQLVLPDRRGRVYIELRHAVLTADNSTELLTLVLTARGAVTAGHSAESGLELGHKAIVTLFAEVTGATAHQRWGKSE